MAVPGERPDEPPPNATSPVVRQQQEDRLVRAPAAVGEDEVAADIEPDRIVEPPARQDRERGEAQYAARAVQAAVVQKMPAARWIAALTSWSSVTRLSASQV